MNQFSIGHMVNPKINANKVFRYQLEILFKEAFHSSSMSGIQKCIEEVEYVCY